MSDNLVLDIEIDPSRAQSGAGAVQRALDGIKGSWIDLSAKAFVVERAFERVWQGAKGAAEFDESMSRLNRQAGLFNKTASQMVIELERVTAGQLSHAQAAQVASRAFQMGLDDKQLLELGQAGETLSDIYGGTVVEAMDDLTRAIGTGSSRMLSQRGIFVDLEKELQKYAVATHRSTEEISDQEKVRIRANLILGQTQQIVQRLSTDQDSDADKLRRFEAQWENLTLQINQASKAMALWTIEKGKAFAKSADEAFDKFLPFIPGGSIQDFFDPSGKMGLPNNLTVDNTMKRLPLPPSPAADPKLLMLGAEGNRERADASMKDELERIRMGLEERTKLFEDDARRGLITEEQSVKAKTDIQLKGIQAEAETLTRQLELEVMTQRRRQEIGFQTTEELIASEEKHKTRVQEIQASIATNAAQFERATTEGMIAERLAREEAETRLGQRITDSLVSQYRIAEDMHRRDQDGTIKYYDSLLSFQQTYGTSRDNLLRTEYDRVRASLARELDVNFETAAKVLDAWRNSDHQRADTLLAGTTKTTQELEAIWMNYMARQREISERFSDDILAGFGKSMRAYVDDKSMFGLGADQARRIAQSMEQAFGKFFFDGMEGRVRSLEDVLNGLLDFTKQIMSEIAGKLITRSILGGLGLGEGSPLSGLGGSPLSGMGGGVSSFSTPGGSFFMVNKPYARGGVVGIPGYAGGGMPGLVNRPQLFIAGEGSGTEAVVPLPDGRSIPVSFNLPKMPTPQAVQQHTTNVSVPVHIVNNSPSEVEVQRSQGPGGLEEIEVIIHNVVKKGFGNGQYDKSMQRFGNRVKGVNR